MFASMVVEGDLRCTTWSANLHPQLNTPLRGHLNADPAPPESRRRGNIGLSRKVLLGVETTSPQAPL